MATFYAKYPATTVAVAGTSTVQGPGTAGTPTGGVLTIQGDPAGTPVPITGSISATNPSVGATGASVPASGTYLGVNNGGTLIGAVADSSGRQIVAGAGTAGSAAGGVLTVQGSASGTAIPVSGSVTVSGTVAATQSGTWTVQPGNTANTTPWLSTISQGGNAATVSAGGALKVDGSAATQPVSGTVTANAGSGTFTVSGTVTANAGTGTFTTSSAVTAAAWQAEGAIAAGSLTTSFATALTTSAALIWVGLRNNTNGSVVVSLDSGSTSAFTLDAGDQVSLDLKSNGRQIAASVTIQAKYTGSAPTTGSFRVNVMS
jgi:hypothetical protein